MTVSIIILPDEKELFARVAEGDQAAFTKIFDHYEPRIYPFVLKITRSEIVAEEIVQELFIKLWINRAAVKKIKNPRSYIFRMATNRTINYLKTLARQVRSVEKITNQVAVENNATEEMVNFKETVELINEAVSQLPEQQKKVYLLSRREGLNADEIAARMNLSNKTVKNHLTEALHRIKIKLQNSPGAITTLIVFLILAGRLLLKYF